MNKQQFLDLAQQYTLFIAIERARVCCIPNRLIDLWALMHRFNKINKVDVPLTSN